MKRVRNLILAIMGLAMLGGTVAAAVVPAVTASAASSTPAPSPNGVPWLS
jgi:hypothetical protein